MSQLAVENPCINTGDTTWVLVSTVLVLSMFGGLAFFEAGLLRSKNTQSIMIQVFGGLMILSFMWDIFGYSLTFGKDHAGVIGDFQYSFLLGVDYNVCSHHAPHIPAALFALFMMMFAAITPLLMTGSFAERLSWRAFVVLIVFWELIVFYPVAHWVWGGGWLQMKLGAWLNFPVGVLDFAGGIVIHTSAGVGSLVLALMMGQRKDFHKYHGEFPPSNLPLAGIGTMMLYCGWFGFNAGSALTGGSVATSALASTQIAACTSGLVWLVASWFRGKPTSVAVMGGIVAGLAGITPASGFINSQATIILGLILGCASYFSFWFLKTKLHIDDALDVTSIHGLTGVIGSLAIGVCSELSLNSAGADGWIASGSAKLLGIQAIGVLVVAAYSAVMTFLLALAIKVTLGLRVREEYEIDGLDIAEHGEYAYHNLWMMEPARPAPLSSEGGNIINETTALLFDSEKRK